MRVKDVLELLAAGAERDEILADYPYLENEDKYSAIAGCLPQSGRATVGSRGQASLRRSDGSGCAFAQRHLR